MNQNQFFGAGAGRSRAFKGGAGAEFFYLEPEPRKNGSAPQHCFKEFMNMQGHLGRDYEGQVEELLNNDPFSEDKLWLRIRDTLVIVVHKYKASQTQFIEIEDLL